MVDLPSELYSFETRNLKTTYRSEYCEAVIEMGAQGMSQKEIARELGIYQSTFHHWLNSFPEFKAAVGIANDLAQGWWERAGRLGTFGAERLVKLGTDADGNEVVGKDFNANAYSLQMRNRFRKDWTDSQSVDHRSSDGSMSPRRIELVPGGPDEPQPQEPQDG